MSEWISVSERLPDHLQEVLVTDGKYTAVVNLHEGDMDEPKWMTYFRFRNGVVHQATLSPPTHWQPLPPPPKPKLTKDEALRKAVEAMEEVKYHFAGDVTLGAQRFMSTLKELREALQ